MSIPSLCCLKQRKLLKKKTATRLPCNAETTQTKNDITAKANSETYDKYIYDKHDFSIN